MINNISQKTDNNSNNIEYNTINQSRNPYVKINIMSSYIDKIQENNKSHNSQIDCSFDSDSSNTANRTRSVSNISYLNNIKSSSYEDQYSMNSETTYNEDIQQINKKECILDIFAIKKAYNEKNTDETSDNVEYGDKSNLNSNKIDNINNFGEILEYSNEKLAKLIQSIKD